MEETRFYKCRTFLTICISATTLLWTIVQIGRQKTDGQLSKLHSPSCQSIITLIVVHTCSRPNSMLPTTPGPPTSPASPSLFSHLARRPPNWTLPPFLNRRRQRGGGVRARRQLCLQVCPATSSKKVKKVQEMELLGLKQAKPASYCACKTASPQFHWRDIF